MRGKKDDRINEILKMQKIKSPQDLFQIIDCIYMYGRPCNEYGDKLADKLLCLLVGQPGKEYGYGREFFEFIIREYSSNNREQEMLLAISGISDNYKNFSDAAECREEYLVYYNQKYTDKPVNDESGMRHREKKALRAIANKVYSSFRTKNDQSFLLCKEWMSERGIDVSGLESQKDRFNSRSRESKKGQSKRITPIIFIINFSNNQFNYKPRRSLLIVSIFGMASIIALPFTLSYISSARKNVAPLDKLYSDLNPPTIESISLKKYKFTLKEGEPEDLGIKITPTEADKNEIKYDIAEENIAAITQDWEVVGLNGWQEDGKNVTEIDFWGGDAELVRINVELEPGYIDGAQDEEYRNQTDVGQYNNYDGAN